MAHVPYRVCAPPILSAIGIKTEHADVATAASRTEASNGLNCGDQMITIFRAENSGRERYLLRTGSSLMTSEKKHSSHANGQQGIMAIDERVCKTGLLRNTNRAVGNHCTWSVLSRLEILMYSGLPSSGSKMPLICRIETH